MLGEGLLDPTAGERARLIHEVPGAPVPIVDPTDPRSGLLTGAEGVVPRRHPDEHPGEDPTLGQAA